MTLFPYTTLFRSRTEQVAARLSERVRADAPHLLPWLPLLGTPLDVELTSTKETEELDEQFRKSRLQDAVIELLARTLPGPTILVLEDVHLMDESSADLLRRLAEGLDSNPWLVVVTRRELPAGFTDRKSTRLNSSHHTTSRMPSSA